MNPKTSASKIGLLIVLAIAAASASLAAQEKPALWHMTTLYAFTGNADGAVPYGGVVLDPAGNVYGTTTFGGNFGGFCGTAGCGVPANTRRTSGGPAQRRMRGHTHLRDRVAPPF